MMRCDAMYWEWRMENGEWRVESGMAIPVVVRSCMSIFRLHLSASIGRTFHCLISEVRIDR